MSAGDEQTRSTKPGESVDDGKGRVFPCEQCGADLEFHIGQQDLKCPFCGHEKRIELAPDTEIAEQDFHAILEKVRAWRQSGENTNAGQSEVRCSGCGANVVFVGSLTSSECPYCGAPIQRDKVHDSPKRIPVHGILSFQVEKEKARMNLSEWVRSRWFAPNEFLKRGVEGRFNGVYLPFWTYDSMTFSRYCGARGDNYTQTFTDSNGQTRTETHTRWTSVSGSHQRFFDDVLVLATKGMNRDLMDSLEPWPLGSIQPFTQELLAGFLARTYEVELDEGFPIAKKRIDAGIEADVRQLIGGDHQRIDKLQTRYDAITFKHLLLPVWLLAYRYHDKSFQVLVNAVTGEVQGERPYSVWKITLTVLLVLAVVGVIAYFQSHG